MGMIDTCMGIGKLNKSTKTTEQHLCSLVWGEIWVAVFRSENGLLVRSRGMYDV